jgi:hypothetical protein
VTEIRISGQRCYIRRRAFFLKLTGAAANFRIARNTAAIAGDKPTCEGLFFPPLVISQGLVDRFRRSLDHETKKTLTCSPVVARWGTALGGLSRCDRPGQSHLLQRPAMHFARRAFG